MGNSVDFITKREQYILHGAHVNRFSLLLITAWNKYEWTSEDFLKDQCFNLCKYVNNTACYAYILHHPLEQHSLVNAQQQLAEARDYGL